MKESSRTSFTTTKRRAGWMLALLLIAGCIAEPRPFNWVSAQASKLVGTELPRINLPFVLGLDLEGGTHLEYEAEVDAIPAADRREALNGVRDVVERRVNALGVSEPLVQTIQSGSAWRVIVELAGIRDVNQAIKLIGETPILEFKEQNTDAPRVLTAEEKTQIETQNQQARTKAEQLLAEARKPGADFAALAAQSDVEATKLAMGEVGFLSAHPEAADLKASVSQLPSGTIYDKVIERDHSYAVVQVEESKETGKQEAQVSHILISYADSQVPGLSTSTKEEARAKINQIKTEVTVQNFAELAKRYSQEPTAKTTGGSLGWFGPGETVTEFETVAFAQASGTISNVVESPLGFHLIYKQGERPQKDVRVRMIELNKQIADDIIKPSPWKTTQLTGKQLESAKVEFDSQTRAVQVVLQFDSEGTKLFADLTKKNLGKPVAIFLDGQSISEPVVQSEIVGGRATISGSYGIAEAKLLAGRLQAGALPVPIKLIQQQTVGPTLGADSLTRSLNAGLAGFILVALFMVLLYRIPGVVSIVALCLYILLTAALFKLIPVTMTLAGIAGFILSMGIALDANVLAFERLKEEWKSGKNMNEAFEESFRRAWPSIRDGHVTVLISAAVLYGFSSSGIRGFALTLAIGTLLSLFTAIVSTRTILRLLAHTGLRKYPWWFLKSRDIV